MFPFAPSPGTFTGMRPTAQQPDAPLSDDDAPASASSTRSGTTPNSSAPSRDASFPESALAAQRLRRASRVSSAHTSSPWTQAAPVIAGILGGWVVRPRARFQFDGTYQIGALAVNRTYKIYAEPLTAPSAPPKFPMTLVSLCP